MDVSVNSPTPMPELSNNLDYSTEGFNAPNITVIEVNRVLDANKEQSINSDSETAVEQDEEETKSAETRESKLITPEKPETNLIEEETARDLNPASCDGEIENKVIKSSSGEGSDSGVEFVGVQRDFEAAITPARSCDSSIISCCSNHEEAYNLLVKRNSSLLEDYKLRSGDGTSEGGSESSSVAGGSTIKSTRRPATTGARRKLPITNDSTNTRSRPKVSPKKSTLRAKSRENGQVLNVMRDTKSSASKTVPKSLPLTQSVRKTPVVNRVPSVTRSTPGTTPTDDGRWPSVNSRPAPLMGRTSRGPSELKAKPPKSRESSMTRSLTIPSKRTNLRDSTTMSPRTPLIPYPRKQPSPKTKIYHEVSIQTSVTLSDIEKAFAGVQLNVPTPHDIERCDKDVHVEIKSKEVEKLEQELRVLREKHEQLEEQFKEGKKKLSKTEELLRDEEAEKKGLQDELKQNQERVLAILGNDRPVSEDENSSDSLMVLENHYQHAAQIIIKQENEISELNSYARSLKKELDKTLATQQVLIQQHQELKSESVELQDFMEAEKSMIVDALKEAEAEVQKLKAALAQKEKEVDTKQDESKHLVRISEQRRQENLALQAQLCSMEARSRKLLVYQNGNITAASVALSSLVSRLEVLVEELVTSYGISEQDLEDMIFHNEAYVNGSSSPDATPENCNSKALVEKAPSPKRGSTFVSAIIHAIKSATAQSPFSREKDSSNDTICTEASDSTGEMLDSETEPCLMMEHVLEDVVVPDGHSHNMISSGHSLTRLTHSESLNNLSQAILNRQLSEQDGMKGSFVSDTFAATDFCHPVTLVDQVIEVDNVITRLLKVLRIIQIENEEYMNELQDERDALSEQVDKQKDANKMIVQQLKDWEMLGGHLKSEVHDLMTQIGKSPCLKETWQTEKQLKPGTVFGNSKICTKQNDLNQSL